MQLVERGVSNHPNLVGCNSGVNVKPVRSDVQVRCKKSNARTVEQGQVGQASIASIYRACITTILDLPRFRATVSVAIDSVLGERLRLQGCPHEPP